MSKSSIFKLRLKVLNSSAERQLCDSEFQTEGALTLKALADNESAIRGTDSASEMTYIVSGGALNSTNSTQPRGTESNSLSADRSVLSGW